MLNRIGPSSVFPVMRGRHVTGFSTIRGRHAAGAPLRRVGRTPVSLLAGGLVWVALLAPDRPDQLSAASLLRVPVEALVVVLLLVLLSGGGARVTSVLAGVALGLVSNLAILDAGFLQALDRPVHLATDWPLIGSAVDYVTATWGRSAAWAAQAAAVVTALGVVTVMILCMLRMGHLARRHRTVALRLVAVLTVVWTASAAVGIRLDGRPVAARGAVAALRDHAAQARRDLADQRTFATQLAPRTSPTLLSGAPLSGLRGHDVVLTFVESYGRSAIEDPGIAPAINEILDTGTRDLAAAGFSARSAFLTSPTVGGGSWIAHSTFLSGTWVDNQVRYNQLLASTHPTLVSDFRDAGWRTVATMPGTAKDWPEGSFYGYDRIYNAPSLDYHGPRFGWSPMPDEFTLEAIQARELGRARSTPLMLEIELTSSHIPWTPQPRQVGWDAVGDGSVFAPMAVGGLDQRQVLADKNLMRREYGRSVQYTLSTLISFLRTFGTDHTVLIFLGDHQPSPGVTGADASRDVPITIVTRDHAILDRIAGWRWREGLRPPPDAPVWTMDSFRNSLVTTFSARTP